MTRKVRFMNWRVFVFWVITCSVHFNIYTYTSIASATLAMHRCAPCNATLSSTNNHYAHHSCNWLSPSYLYLQQKSLAIAGQSWNERDFAHEIERSINHCMACGYSRAQAEKCILKQHALYVFPNFIANIQQFDGYCSYIKELHHTLLNNKGKFYRLRRALGCVNRGYVQLCDITERLHGEIVAQEKLEDARSKPVPSRDKNARQQRSHQQESVSDRREAVRNTFDTQCGDLTKELGEWHEIREIYQEEQLGDTTRIDRRIQALQVINDGKVIYTEQTYILSCSAATLLRNSGNDSVQYTTHYGNQLQHVIHQECIEGIEHLATLHPSAVMFPYKHGIAECFDAACQYNQEGFTNKAATITDFCWTLLDCGVAITEGAVDGVLSAVKDMAEHPVQTAICAVAGEYVLAYELSKVLYNVADIGITALSDSDQARQKWDEYIALVTQLIDTITHQQLTLRDTLKGATQLAVQWKTQDKLLKGLNSICTTAKTKVIEFAKNNPLSTPQEYMATPEGILLKSMHNTPPSGSSLKYERSSKLFIANHEEIISLTEQAKHIVQPSKEVLHTIGRDSFNTTEKFLKHVFAAELKEKWCGSEVIHKSLSGFHHYILEHLEQMDVKLFNTRICNKTGVAIADVLCEGHLERQKTFFPSSWSREKVISKLGEVLKNPIDEPRVKGSRIRFLGQTSEGIVVRVVADIHSGDYITAYPDAHANGLI